MNKETSEEIRAVGFLCAMLVVPIHCVTATTQWIAGNVVAPRWVAALQMIGSDTVSRLAVPWFFVISGFFLVLKLPRIALCREIGVWWRDSILKRLVTLGVPYVLWNIIYYVFKLVTGKYSFDIGQCIEQLSGWNLIDVPACGQFWYIRCLLIYVLVAPIFVMLMRIKRVGLVVLGFLFLAWVFGMPLPIPVYVQPMDYSYLLYFSSGMFAAFHSDSLTVRREIGAGVAIAFVACAAGVVVGGVNRVFVLSQVSGKLMILFGLPMLWSVRSYIAAALRPCKKVWSQGFFVYAFHILVVSVVGKFMNSLLPDHYHTIGYFVKVVSGVSVSIAFGCALNRIVPSVFKSLCGGRE